MRWMLMLSKFDSIEMLGIGLGSILLCILSTNGLHMHRDVCCSCMEVHTSVGRPESERFKLYTPCFTFLIR